MGSIRQGRRDRGSGSIFRYFRRVLGTEPAPIPDPVPDPVPEQPPDPGLCIRVEGGIADRVVVRRRRSDRSDTIYVTVNASTPVLVEGAQLIE